MTGGWALETARTSVPAETIRGRTCLVLRIRPELIPDYVADHQRVWPEMLEALRRTGWRNYSLFLREQDGMVIGYFEADDVDAARDAMNDSEVNRRWQQSMARYFVPGSRPEFLPLCFHLE